MELSTVSNALDRSINTAAVNFFLMVWVCKSFTNLHNACSVLCLNLNPNWSSDSILLAVRYLYTFMGTVFSKTLEMLFRKLIGLWFVSLSFSSFLNSGMMRASFNLEWKFPLVGDLLIKYLNGCIYTAMQDFMIFVGIPPGTDNDFGLSLAIASISSL